MYVSVIWVVVCPRRGAKATGAEIDTLAGQVVVPPPDVCNLGSRRFNISRAVRVLDSLEIKH